MVKRRKKQLLEPLIFTAVKDKIRSFELKKFARRANLQSSKMTSANWKGFANNDRKMDTEKRDTVNQVFNLSEY